MKINLLAFLGLLIFSNFSSFAEDRTLVIENSSERGVYLARSIETEEEIITEGYWHVLPQEENVLGVPLEGKLSARLNFDEDRNPFIPAEELVNLKRCGSPLDRFKSIVKKNGDPQVILFIGSGEMDGYAEKKEGATCEEAGGEILEGFYETIPCEPDLTGGEMCLPFLITATETTPSMYVGFCNETLIPALYLSVRFFEKNEWRTQGWWEVVSNKCRKVGPFPTNQPVYVFATNSVDDPEPREWTPVGSPLVSSWVNPEVGFLYAEKPDGTCETRINMSDESPLPEKANFGKLVEAGFHGVATFNIRP